MIRIVTVVGARPQFIKAAVVSRAIDRWNALEQRVPIDEVVVHTGQHYDYNMSQVFFNELDLRPAHFNLGIGGGRHGAMTGQMLCAIEDVLLQVRPDWLLVYGDTNSTLAGALAAAKLQIPVIHVEAGLRSFNRAMPEEINRVLTDHVAEMLFCPTSTAVGNLRREGVIGEVVQVGDVMFDASLHYRDRALAASDALKRLGLRSGQYVLATCHRAENTDDPRRLRAILDALGVAAETLPVVLPLHPRTRAAIAANEMEPLLHGICVTEPLSFFDMIQLEQAARVIVTDSGGVQKEAFFFRVPCITLRTETEWTETIDSGWNKLLDVYAQDAVAAILSTRAPESWPSLYGDGRAGDRIVEAIVARDRSRSQSAPPASQE